MMEFFKLIRKHNAEIESQKKREWRKTGVYILDQQQGQSTARSTGVHKAGSVERSVDRCAQTCTG